MRIKVRSTVSVMGLRPGQEVEIDLTETVRSLLRAGLLKALRPTNG